MSIQHIAVYYGDAERTNGARSCPTCNYAYNTIKELICGLHELPTRPDKVCGSWCDDKVKKPKETQTELF